MAKAVWFALEQEDWQNDDDVAVGAGNNGSHAGW